MTSYSLALREIDTVQDEDEYVPNALEVILRKVGRAPGRGAVAGVLRSLLSAVGMAPCRRTVQRVAAARAAWERLWQAQRGPGLHEHAPGPPLPLSQGHLDMLEEPLISTLLRHKWEAFARTQVRLQRMRAHRRQGVAWPRSRVWRV